MDIKPIKTENDYNQALERLEIIFDAKKGSPEGDELEVLGILVDQYENDHFPIGMPACARTYFTGLRKRFWQIRPSDAA